MSDITQIERRLALVIGNADYVVGGVLRNPINDALAMCAALTDFGFEIIGGKEGGINLTGETLRKCVKKFADRLDEDQPSVSLLYYAGHGIQIEGLNFLVPVDATLKTQNSIEWELIGLDNILKYMDRDSRFSLALIDACRNNPFAENLAQVFRTTDTRSISVGASGLVAPTAGYGTLIAFAASPGRVAFDGEGKNGYFTAAILE